MSQYRRSTARGSSPISKSVRSRTEPAMPYGLRLSLHSPQPTRPSSVSTLTNVHGRQPASQWNASTRSMRIRRASHDTTVFDVLGRRPKTSPKALSPLAAFRGQTSQKFGQLRLERKTGLSAELLVWSLRLLQ